MDQVLALSGEYFSADQVWISWKLVGWLRTDPPLNPCLHNVGETNVLGEKGEGIKQRERRNPLRHRQQYGDYQRETGLGEVRGHTGR